MIELAVIGAGNMAEAIVRSALAEKVLRPAQVVAADLSAARRELFSSQLGIPSHEHARDAAVGAKCILLSVKPQHMPAVLAELSGVLDPSCLVISIAAGISSRYIEAQLGSGNPWRVVRVMPNTPMLAGCGMAALSAGAHAGIADLAAARRLFEAGAKIIELPEDKMDAVTAISGSGPAYFFYLVELMVQAGVEMGLSPDDAHLLATQTALGAAKMMTAGGDLPAELRRKVTSPGGTTQAAIQTMQARGVDAGIVAALHAAAGRSRELGK